MHRILALAATGLFVPFAPIIGQMEMSDWDTAVRQSVEFKLKDHSDGSYTLTSETSVEAKVLDERAAKLEYFSIFEPFYAPIKKFKVKVNSSSLSKDYINFGSAQQTDVFLENGNQYTVHFPSPLKVNDIVSYSYQQQYSEVVFLPILYVRNYDHVSEYRAIFKHPDDVTVEFELYFPRDSVAYTVDRTDNEETILRFSKLDHHENLKFFSGNRYHAAVLVSLKSGSRNINPVLPEEYVAWYHGKTKAQPQLDSLHERTFDKKLSGRTTRNDSLATIHDSVRASIRYVADERGISAFIPRPPSVTLQAGFGDCKDRVALVSGIAYDYGIPTITVLVPSPESPRFTGVHVGMFNHVIGAYQGDSQLVYFDPTAKYCEFGNLPDNDLGKRVFVMESHKARFETIGVPPREPSLDIVIQGHIDSLNRCKAGIILRNGLLSEVLHARHDLTEEKLKSMLTTLVATRLYQVRLESFKVTAEEYRQITVAAIADLSKFVLPSGNKYYVPRTPFAQFDNDVLERESDRFALEFSTTVDMRFQLNLIAPNVSVQPETAASGNPSFSFSAESGFAGGMISFLYHYRRNTIVVQPDEKTAYINHYRSYLANKKNVFVMIRR